MDQEFDSEEWNNNEFQTSTQISLTTDVPKCNHESPSKRLKLNQSEGRSQNLVQGYISPDSPPCGLEISALSRCNTDENSREISNPSNHGTYTPGFGFEISAPSHISTDNSFLSQDMAGSGQVDDSALPGGLEISAKSDNCSSSPLDKSHESDSSSQPWDSLGGQNRSYQSSQQSPLCKLTQLIRFY